MRQFHSLSFSFPHTPYYILFLYSLYIYKYLYI
nr:MAG TPA: hypothetical protein [Caudoviricetes sp.]